MASYEELVAREDAIREVLRRGAARRLRSLPGVVHVGVGLKETGGRATDLHCIRVTVREKVRNDQLSPDQRIPGEIDGVPTDVNVQRRFNFAIDTTRYRPVKGGALIGNKIIGLNQAGTRPRREAGTLGCTATRTSDRSIVLLSNWHVLTALGAGNGDPIFQPCPITPPVAALEELPIRPTDTTDVIARIVDSTISEHVDAAIARLDLSSCCRCCGIDYRDEINGLSVGGHPPSNNILGQRPAVSGATVYKVGMRTGRTVGRVVATDTDNLQGTFEGHTYTLNGQIEIESAPGSADPFSALGDSGSVIIDDDGYIVGLLFGSTPDAPPSHRTYANHIADVCTAMGITINLTMGSHPTADARRLLIPDEVGAELYAAARARVLADPAGAWLWALGERHREEIVSLVTRRRPVVVAWHRLRGPAFFAEAVHTLRNGGETLPQARDGITLEAGLARMGGVLRAHGSADLGAAIDRHGEALLAAVRDSATLADLLGKLRQTAAGAQILAGAGIGGRLS